MHSTSRQEVTKKHTLQIFHTNWIFYREGSTKADASFAVTIYITLVQAI